MSLHQNLYLSQVQLKLNRDPLGNNKLRQLANKLLQNWTLEFSDTTPTGNPQKFWEGCTAIDRKTGASVDVQTALNMPLPDNTSQTVDIKVTPVETPASGWIAKTSDGIWQVRIQSRIAEFPLEEVQHVAETAYAHGVPNNGAVSIMADGHHAGDIWVGWVSSSSHGKYPYQLISGDIGCGMTTIPVVDLKTQKQLNVNDIGDLAEFKKRVLIAARTALKRGRAAERGEATIDYLEQVQAFFQSDSESFEHFVSEIYYVVKTCGLYNGSDDSNSVLAYISGFAQSLGSSGNHFFELSVTDDGALFIVIHSGSRALGALVYKKIAECAREVSHGTLNSNERVVTGALAEFYSRAVSVLTEFASMNRALCAIAVLHELNFCIDGETLAQAMYKHPVFAAATPTEARAMIKGLVHNGIKVFVNDTAKQLVYVCCKGSIAICDRASVAIVALRAGEGCVLYTMRNPDSPWRETTMAEANELLDEQRSGDTHYEVLTEIPEQHIKLAGHGAGRSKATNKTRKETSYRELMEFFIDPNIDVLANIAPAVLGDHPAKGYKPSAEVLENLPLKEAASQTNLRTLVSYKEGISNIPGHRQQFLDFVKDLYANDHEFFMKYGVMLDLILVKSLDEPWIDARMAELKSHN